MKRLFPGSVVVTTAAATALHWLLALCAAQAGEINTIDRFALVTRHNVVLTNADPFATLQVGNGEFAFAVERSSLATNVFVKLACSPGAFTRSSATLDYVTAGRHSTHALRRTPHHLQGGLLDNVAPGA